MARKVNKSKPQSLDQKLADRLRIRMNEVGWADTYDPDFLLGCIIEWLHENDAALTNRGVRRFRR